MGENSPILLKRKNLHCVHSGWKFKHDFYTMKLSQYMLLVKIHPWLPLWKYRQIFTWSIWCAKNLTLWQFFNIIISPKYLISCQHKEKRNIDKDMKFYSYSSKIESYELWDEYVGDFSPTAYGEGLKSEGCKCMCPGPVLFNLCCQYGMIGTLCTKEMEKNPENQLQTPAGVGCS